MKSKKLLLSIIASGILAVNSNSASLWDDSSIFHNVTSSHISTDPMSGGTYMSGGGIEVRFKGTGSFPPIFGFGAPGLKASCSGITFDAGYAVFMNLERLGQQLSQAGASLAYGVLIGLVYTMPGVEQAFTKLNEWSQWLQSFLADSCNIGVNVGKELGRQAWRNVEGGVHELTNKIPSPNDVLGKPTDIASNLEKLLTDGTSDQKESAKSSITDDLFKDARAGIVATYINSLLKRGEENITFSQSEIIEFKPLDSIGLTASTKIMAYFITSIIDDIALDEKAVTIIAKGLKTDDAKLLAEQIEAKGGNEGTFRSIQARNKNATSAFVSFMLNGKNAGDASVFSNLRGLRTALISLDNKTGVRDTFVTLLDTTGNTTDVFDTFEGYISESKKLVYKTYNQAMIDLKGAAGPNPITDVIKVTSAYPIMYDLIRNLVLLSDKKQTVEIDAEGTTDVDMLNYIAYRNAIALVGLAVENMNQAIKKSTTELDNKIKEAANNSPISSEISNSVKHLNLLKEQKIVLDKEIEKIKEELNKKIVQIESNENVRRMNERFEQALRERNLQKGDK